MLFGFFPNLAPARFGGVEASGRLAWDALREMARARGETATLFCYTAGEPENTPLEWDALVARSKTQAIWRVLRVKAKPRVIVVWHLALLKLVPFLRARDARVIVFLHGIEAWRVQDPLTRWLLPRVHVFLSNSAYTYDRFLQFHPHLEKIAQRIVPLGIGDPAPAVSESLPPRALMLSRLARGEDYKGHRELLDAWTRVLEKIPDAELWIAGDGDLRVDLETTAHAKNLDARVKFLGRVSDAQKQELLRASRALMMPSRGEGFGLVYVEAMRWGRPCLVSDCDAGRAVVNPPEAGLAANPNDADALERAVVRLLTPGEEWDAWSRAARKRYAEHFTAAQFQKRLCASVSEWL